MQTDEFGYHEVLDRLSIIRSLVDDFLVEHVAVVENPMLLALINIVSNNLADAYQVAGKISFEKFSEALPFEVAIAHYPAIFTPAKAGFVVTFKDVPEALTQGHTFADAVYMAIDALKSAKEIYQELGKDLPAPSAQNHDNEQEHLIPLYQEMTEAEAQAFVEAP